MTPKEVRKLVDKCFDGDMAALDWLMENDLMLVDLLLNVADAAKVIIEEQKLTSKNSYLADAMEEFELEPWVIIPAK